MENWIFYWELSKQQFGFWLQYDAMYCMDCLNWKKLYLPFFERQGENSTGIWEKFGSNHFMNKKLEFLYNIAINQNDR